MFLNYLKIAFRTLWNNKMYSLINILGLGIAMAVVMLIAVFVSYDFSFDQCQPDKERTYRVTQEFEKITHKGATTSSGLAPLLFKNFSYIDSFCRIGI